MCELYKYLYTAIAQTQTGTLLERWLSGEGGLLGLSLILNVVLFNIAWYLLRLSLKKEAEKATLVEKFTKDILGNIVEITRALTELSTIIKGKYKQ
jgi:Pyruvate/2-oxoacid:ferredoxin oxidoreductase gamma subunit